MSWRPCCLAGCVLLLTAATPPLRAASPADAGADRAQQALPPLPAPPRLELPEPTAEELATVDALLERLHAEAAHDREAAARELLEVDARSVPAIAFRLRALAARADKEAMKRLFTQIRERARDDTRDDDKSTKKSADSKGSPDYLTMLVADRRGDPKTYADLIDVVAQSRMLTQIGTVEAVRVLIEVYVRFGEFLRIHTQRELATLGERAVPALIEARRHPAEKIGSWARRQLDMLGRAVPSETVQTPNHQVLADVLRAYGRTRDPDATRIVASFANSERALVREAARQAIVLMGEVALWQLRDSYETTVGKKPPRDWGWERAARELFAEFDRMRSADVTHAFETGRVARARGDLAAMRRAYDEVLAKDPRFGEREELVSGYSAYADQVMETDAKLAQEALVRAERLAESPEARARFQSQLLTLRAAAEAKRGVADTTLLKRALELDPRNQRARSLLDGLQRGDADDSSKRARQLAASTIGVGALAALWILLRRRNAPTAVPAPSGGPPPPSG